MADVTPEERLAVKKFLRIQSKSILDSKYPASLEKFSKADKQCFSFMKNLNPTDDFTFKGKKSNIKSEDIGGMILDVLGGNHSSNNDFMGNDGLRHPIFHLSNNSNNDDRFSDAH